MNFSDSERLAHFLEKSKFKLAPAIDEADLVIFNSCGVRKMAEDRALGQIHNLKKNNSKIKIALTGCISHRKDIKNILEKNASRICAHNLARKKPIGIGSSCLYSRLILS